jgi:hypothetical protein
MTNPSLTEWVTAAVAVFTAWMAWETRKTAKAAAASVEAAQQPHLSLQTIDFAQGPIGGPHPAAGQLGAQLTLGLKNPGQVRIVYDVEMADLTLNGAASPPGPYDNHSGVIFPGDVHGFRLPPMPLSSALPHGTTGTLKCRVKYWADPNKRASLECTVMFIVSADVKWTYQSGPKYA